MATEAPRKLPADVLDAAVALMGRSGRGATFPVQGHSMRPTLASGEILAVEFATHEVRPGDVILFRQSDTLVVHRLLGRARARSGGAATWRTRGDGQTYLDPPVDPGRVVGRAVAVQRGGEWLTLAGPAPRAYARCVAWHDLIWAGAAVAARKLDRGAGRLRLGAPFHASVAALDRGLLHGAHRLLFRRLHRAVPVPAVIAELGCRHPAG